MMSWPKPTGKAGFAIFAPQAAIVIAVGLVLAGLAMAIYNENLGKAEKLRDVTVQADILAGSLSAALAFDDSDLAREYVGALGANRDVESAAVYDLKGRLVAGYARPGTTAAPLLAQAPPSDADHIVVARPVAQGAVPLGTVYLRTVREPLTRRAARYGGIAMLIVMAALIVVVLGASNASLVDAHRKLKVEMEERERTEQALRASQEMEAAAQLEIANQRSRAALRQSEQQLEFALDAGRLGGWTADLDTGTLTGSQHFRANFGIDPQKSDLRMSDVLSRVHPDDRGRLSEALARAASDGTAFDLECRTLLFGEFERWVLIRGRADYDDYGVARRMAGVSLDITASKVAEEHQRMLLDELNHRVKNTLATVQSMAIQTRRGTETIERFEASFLARLGALGRVHDLLSRTAWEGASLRDVVHHTLAPHLGDGDHIERLMLQGPDIRLGPNAAVTLTMAFHELATNAAKYGSLSVATGRLNVRWNVEDQSGQRVVEINWSEAGGPSVQVPVRRGFGSRFIERGLAREFDGSVELDFATDGLCCRMRMPLSAKLRMAA